MPGTIRAYFQKHHPITEPTRSDNQLVLAHSAIWTAAKGRRDSYETTLWILLVNVGERGRAECVTIPRNDVPEIATEGCKLEDQRHRRRRSERCVMRPHSGANPHSSLKDSGWGSSVSLIGAARGIVGSHDWRCGTQVQPVCRRSTKYVT